MRKTKISADISEESKLLLDSYCIKHERSKGWLLDKMIKKFCADIKPENAKKKPVKNFKPPTLEEVTAYCNERCNSVDAQSFIDHYTGNGWVRGKTKIKDWKACVRTWEKNSKQSDIKPKQYSDVTAQNIKNLEGGW